jgi:hydrogenase maturation protease
MTLPNKTILLGLGNPILGDDAAGWRVVEALRDFLPDEMAADTLAGGGLSVMERLEGFDRAVIVDTIQTGQAPKGQVVVMPLEALPNPLTGHLSSAHETNLLTALQAGRALGIHLPQQITVVGIETQAVYDFGDKLSAEIEAAVPAAIQAILTLFQ